MALDVHPDSMTPPPEGSEDAVRGRRRAPRRRPSYDPAMTDVTTPAGYAFDPELAEFAALSVRPAPTDPIAAREFSNQMLASLGGDVDVSTLAVEDRRIPGPDGAPAAERAHHSGACQWTRYAGSRSGVSEEGKETKTTVESSRGAETRRLSGRGWPSESMQYDEPNQSS